MLGLLKEWLIRFIRPCKIAKLPFKTDINDGTNWLPNNELLLGLDTATSVMALNDIDRQEFYSKATKYLTTMTEALLHYLPFDNKALRFVRLLDPKKKSNKSFELWVKMASTALNIPPDVQSQLLVESRIYSDLRLIDGYEDVDVNRSLYPDKCG